MRDVIYEQSLCARGLVKLTTNPNLSHSSANNDFFVAACNRKFYGDNQSSVDSFIKNQLKTKPRKVNVLI